MMKEKNDLIRERNEMIKARNAMRLISHSPERVRMLEDYDESMGHLIKKQINSI